MKAENISLSFGSELIYDEASFKIETNAKVGVVGVNGCGKTTLFKVILGIQELDAGKLELVNNLIGYLPQEIKDFGDLETVYEYIFSARPIKKLENELVQVYEELSLANSKDERKLLKKAAKIQEYLDILNQYNAEDDLLELIEEMGISTDMLDEIVSNLSGGQKSKVAFARLLFSNSSTLLLDEPTNHLDASTKSYITDFLKNYKGTCLIISHDVDFLNAVVDHILYIDKTTHKIKLYEGNYSDFKKTYAKDMAAKLARIESQEREIKKLEKIVKKAEEASRTNHNLKRLGASRKIQLEKKRAELESRDKTYKKVNMQFSPAREIGKIPLEVNGLSFSYENKEPLYTNLSFTLSKNEKFLIVGENGIGKSTLLKLLTGKLVPKSGTINFNSKADVAYYAQELEILDENKTVFANVYDTSFSELEVRSILGNFLFSGNDIYKSVAVLSPGEKARVALCKILMTKANLIILDEPTNHFDPETQKIIGENFKNYTGTLIVVSHNPAFVETLGITRMLALPDGKILDYSLELLNYYYFLNTDLM